MKQIIVPHVRKNAISVNEPIPEQYREILAFENEHGERGFIGRVDYSRNPVGVFRLYSLEAISFGNNWDFIDLKNPVDIHDLIRKLISFGWKVFSFSDSKMLLEWLSAESEAIDKT